ncbi:MAG: flagellar protein FlaG [Geothrix sp.]|nr:flagellar protein FlaG [Geothrix sp.]
MVDQVNPTGSLAPGLPLTLPMAAKPPSVQGKPRATKPADSPLEGLEDGRTGASAEALDSAIREFKGYLQQAQSDLVFQVDESSGRTYFKIVDAATKEVIRQVPSEEILAMARKLREMATPKAAAGVLVDREG